MTTLSERRQQERSFFSPTKRLTSYFLISVMATLFDAVSSYLIIVVNPIAVEGNPVWGFIADTFGFAGAMAIRAIAGVLLLCALWIIANQHRSPGGRRYARFGIRVATVLFVLLTIYHVIGTLYFS